MAVESLVCTPEARPLVHDDRKPILAIPEDGPRLALLHANGRQCGGEGDWDMDRADDD